MTGVLKKGEDTQKHTQGWSLCESGGRNWYDAATNQGSTKENQEPLEETKKDSSLVPSGTTCPACT